MSLNPAVLTQIWLVAGLRWRLAVNSLRAPGKKLELVARLLVTVIGGVVIVVVGLVLGVVAFAFARLDQFPRLSILLWGVFLAWQVLPVMLSALAANFDSRNLRRFPLHFTAFFLISLAYGLFDPVAISCIFWLACIGAGVAAARMDLLLWVAAALGMLGSASVCLNRLVMLWLERLLAARRTREKLFLLFIFAMLSAQLLGAAAERVPRDAFNNFVAPFLPWLAALPPGAASGALWSAQAGQPRAALLLFALVAAWCAGLLTLLRARLLAQYRGEEFSEGSAPQAVDPLEKFDESSLSARAAGFLPGPLAALLGKETRYLFRNALTLVQFAVPFFMILFLGILFNRPDDKLSFLKRSPEMLFPSAVGYMLLIVVPMSHNAFSFESRGIQLLLMAPVPFRQVLMAKNLALGALFGAQALLILLLVEGMFGGQQGVIVFATFAALAFGLLVHFTVGNLLSLYYPRAVDFNQFKQNQSGISVLIGLGTQIVLYALIYGIYAAALWWGNLWLALAAYVALAAAALQVYWLTLDFCERLALRRREVLLSEICRD